MPKMRRAGREWSGKVNNQKRVDELINATTAAAEVANKGETWIAECLRTSEQVNELRASIIRDLDAPEQADIPGVEWRRRCPTIKDADGDELELADGQRAHRGLWIGATENGVTLTHEQVRDTLVPLLTRFIATGKLAPEQAEKPKTHGFLVQAVAGAIGVKLDDVDRLIASGESKQAEKDGER